MPHRLLFLRPYAGDAVVSAAVGSPLAFLSPDQLAGYVTAVLAAVGAAGVLWAGRFQAARAQARVILAQADADIARIKAESEANIARIRAESVRAEKESQIDVNTASIGEIERKLAESQAKLDEAERKLVASRNQQNENILATQAELEGLRAKYRALTEVARTSDDNIRAVAAAAAVPVVSPAIPDPTDDHPVLK